MDIAQNSNDVEVLIELKNKGTDDEEWKEALMIVKDWGQELAHTLQEKTPNVELEVKIAGFCCHKSK